MKRTAKQRAAYIAVKFGRGATPQARALLASAVERALIEHVKDYGNDLLHECSYGENGSDIAHRMRQIALLMADRRAERGKRY